MTIATEVEGNYRVCECFLATWKLVQHFVNGLDSLVSCP